MVLKPSGRVVVFATSQANRRKPHRLSIYPFFDCRSSPSSPKTSQVAYSSATAEWIQAILGHVQYSLTRPLNWLCLPVQLRYSLVRSVCFLISFTSPSIHAKAVPHHSVQGNKQRPMNSCHSRLPHYNVPQVVFECRADHLPYPSSIILICSSHFVL